MDWEVIEKVPLLVIGLARFLDRNVLYELKRDGERINQTEKLPKLFTFDGK